MRPNGWLALGLLAVLARLALSPWGPAIVQGDSHYYAGAADLPAWRLLSGRSEDGRRLERPASYPLVLKALGVGEASLEQAKWRVLAFQALASAGVLAAALWLGGALFAKARARLAWGALWLALSLGEFVQPWESLLLTESLASNGLLLAVLGVVALSARGKEEEPRAKAPSRKEERAQKKKRSESPDIWLLAGLGALLVFLSHLREALVPAALLVAGAVALEWLLAGRSQREAPPFASGRALAIFCGAVLASAFLALWQAKTRDGEARDSNFANFVSMRILTDPMARDAFEMDLAPPRSVLRTAGVSFWEERAPLLDRRWQADPERLAWLATYREGQHLRFLGRRPGLARRLLLEGSDGVFGRLGGRGGAEYSDDWGKSPRRWGAGEAVSLAAGWLLASPILLARKLGAWGPFALPLIGLALALIPLRRERAFRAWPLALCLGAMEWSQFGLAILFEGTEDYRHALAGSLALALSFWVPLASLLPTREGAKGVSREGGKKEKTRRRGA